MEEEKVGFFLLKNGKFFDKNDIREVENIVSKVKSDSIANLSVLRFRNPLFMSLLSFFLGMFGVDRFLLGNIKRGILKALTFPIEIIAFILFYKGFNTHGDDPFSFYIDSEVYKKPGVYEYAGMILIFIFVLLVVYYFIDIFLIYRDTYKYNYRVLVDFSGMLTNKGNKDNVSEDVDDGFCADVTPGSSSFTKKLSKSRTFKHRKSSGKSAVGSVVSDSGSKRA